MRSWLAWLPVLGSEGLYMHGRPEGFRELYHCMETKLPVAVFPGSVILVRGVSVTGEGDIGRAPVSSC